MSRPPRKPNVIEIDKQLRRAKNKRSTATPELRELKRDRQRTVSMIRQLEREGDGQYTDAEINHLYCEVDFIDSQRRNTESWQRDTARIMEIQAMRDAIPAEERHKQKLQYRSRKRMYAGRHKKDVLRQVEELRKLGNDSKLFVTFDMERFEHDQEKMLEIGISRCKGQELSGDHYIVEENMRYRNGDLVPDNREKFVFGNSKIRNEREIMRILGEETKKADYVVSHAIDTDWHFLPQSIYNICEHKIIDAQDFFQIIQNKSHIVSIETSCNELHIQTQFLHNAGNDAIYTMIYFMKLLEREVNPPEMKTVK